jgi:L-threonylcarbamoyladenylate synthase
MSRRHYAPKAHLTLHEPGELSTALGQLGECPPEKVVAVVIGDGPELPCDHHQLPADPKGVSARLYALLHDLDSKNYTRILFQAPPKTDEWLAVCDRLQRAASKD